MNRNLLKATRVHSHNVASDPIVGCTPNFWKYNFQFPAISVKKVSGVSERTSVLPIFVASLLRLSHLQPDGAVSAWT